MLYLAILGVSHVAARVVLRHTLIRLFSWTALSRSSTFPPSSNCITGTVVNFMALGPGARAGHWYLFIRASTSIQLPFLTLAIQTLLGPGIEPENINQGLTLLHYLRTPLKIQTLAISYVKRKIKAIKLSQNRHKKCTKESPHLEIIIVSKKKWRRRSKETNWQNRPKEAKILFKITPAWNNTPPPVSTPVFSCYVIDTLNLKLGSILTISTQGQSLKTKFVVLRKIVWHDLTKYWKSCIMYL